MILICKNCQYRTDSPHKYYLHTLLHKNLPNHALRCGIPNCHRTFKFYSTFRSHIYRFHSFKTNSQKHQINTNLMLKCTVTNCADVSQGLQCLLRHLRQHITEGTAITCPFEKCFNQFLNKKTFSSHMSRKHQRQTIAKAGLTVHPDSAEDLFDSPHDDSFSVEMETDTSVTSKDEFIRCLGLFYLKLTAKCLMPSSLLQEIIDGFQGVHDIMQSNISGILERKLSCDLALENLKDLLEEIQNADLLRHANETVFHSTHKRITFYKSNFHYVSPRKLFLGVDNTGISRFSQYIPIKESLVALFMQKSMVFQYNQSCKNQTDNTQMNDICHGSLYSSNPLFNSRNAALSIILYQDAFEVANPLGSGKKKHKILAVYYTLGNISVHYRSKPELMQLVLLCREEDAKGFGPQKVFNHLIEDLKELEEKGLTLANGRLTPKAIVFAIAGDNLGSHGIGGFNENFSKSKFFCRYCVVERENFLENPLKCAQERTIQNYNETLIKLEADASVNSLMGIKSNSVFNTLTNFHVCKPGLPPCLGHDLFEGVVAVDVAIFIEYFVSSKKYFTYKHLNKLINRFSYSAEDRNNMPSSVNINAVKLSGQAVQNWTFLRLLPLIVGERVKFPWKDDVWLLLLHLRRIVNIICAPKITTNLIAILRQLIIDYLDLRQHHFPDHSLLPKHHYLSHYPNLILKFGPLIRLWTLRFESKHSYFKECVRKLHNFKNVPSMLAKRHQLLQSYLSSGEMFPPVLQYEHAVQFSAELYNDQIKLSMEPYNFCNVNSVICNTIKYKGTTYKQNLFLPVTESEEGYVFGEICFFIVESDTTLYVLIKEFQCIYLSDLGLYKLQEDFTYSCKPIEQFLDYYPLPKYKFMEIEVISLHHSYVSIW